VAGKPGPKRTWPPSTYEPPSSQPPVARGDLRAKVTANRKKRVQLERPAQTDSQEPAARGRSDQAAPSSKRTRSRKRPRRDGRSLTVDPTPIPGLVAGPQWRLSGDSTGSRVRQLKSQPSSMTAGISDLSMLPDVAPAAVEDEVVSGRSSSSSLFGLSGSLATLTVPEGLSRVSGTASVLTSSQQTTRLPTGERVVRIDAVEVSPGLFVRASDLVVRQPVTSFPLREDYGLLRSAPFSTMGREASYVRATSPPVLTADDIIAMTGVARPPPPCRYCPAPAGPCQQCFARSVAILKAPRDGDGELTSMLRWSAMAVEVPIGLLVDTFPKGPCRICPQAKDLCVKCFADAVRSFASPARGQTATPEREAPGSVAPASDASRDLRLGPVDVATPVSAAPSVLHFDEPEVVVMASDDSRESLAVAASVIADAERL